MRAASGRQSKASMHASYTLSEYFILPGTEQRRIIFTDKPIGTAIGLIPVRLSRGIYPLAAGFAIVSRRDETERKIEREEKRKEAGNVRWGKVGRRRARVDYFSPLCLLYRVRPDELSFAALLPVRQRIFRGFIRF